MKKIILFTMFILVFSLTSCSKTNRRIDINVDTIELISIIVLETDGELVPNPSSPGNFVIVDLEYYVIEDDILSIINGLNGEKVCGEAKCVPDDPIAELRLSFTDGLNEFSIRIGDSGNSIIFNSLFGVNDEYGFYYSSTTEYKEEILEIYNTIVLEYERSKIEY